MLSCDSLPKPSFPASLGPGELRSLEYVQDLGLEKEILRRQRRYPTLQAKR